MSELKMLIGDGVTSDIIKSYESITGKIWLEIDKPPELQIGFLLGYMRHFDKVTPKIEIKNPNKAWRPQ